MTTAPTNTVAGFDNETCVFTEGLVCTPTAGSGVTLNFTWTNVPGSTFTSTGTQTFSGKGLYVRFPRHTNLDISDFCLVGLSDALRKQSDASLSSYSKKFLLLRKNSRCSSRLSRFAPLECGCIVPAGFPPCGLISAQLVPITP
jgi:hypothetical protein